MEIAKEEGIEPRIDHAADFARKNRVLLLKHTLTDTSIDISLGALPFEVEMVERGVLHDIDETLQLRLPTLPEGKPAALTSHAPHTQARSRAGAQLPHNIKGSSTQLAVHRILINV